MLTARPPVIIKKDKLFLPSRLQNASFLRAHLDKLVASEGLNLQEFMFHMLRNCYLVVMTARDESASFRIFSTLNSRGVDLSEVDKLKADLLQVGTAMIFFMTIMSPDDHYISFLLADEMNESRINSDLNLI